LLLLVVFAIATHLIGFIILILPVLVAAIFLTSFFRDPDRTPPVGDNLVLSPGDGKVLIVETRKGTDGKDFRLVSIFLSVFNVHVNRVPISGKVVHVEHKPGKFLKAFEPDAVTENERTEITIESPYGPVSFSQVAGILARRIICYLKNNDSVNRGARFGLIRFGSRIDMYLDPDIEIKVAVGDRVKGGESIIGSFRTNG
jgi:phosphatidylserine decarboxylase